MSDFIFSKKHIKKNNITKVIQSIYKEDKPAVMEFHGKWGSLGVSENLYNGFNPYEDNDYIVVVIGGPVLMFRDNSFINNFASSEGTIAIFQRWLKGVIKWDEDLSGPFVIFIIDKNTDEILCVTDLMSFIPVYKFESSSNIVLSTHVDMLAKVSNQLKNLDEISIIDFILNGVVTYPYTFYKNIFQVAPASEHNIPNVVKKIETNNYWVPIENNTYSSIKAAASDLRNSIISYINKILSETSNIAQFISGGEDSRFLSALLKKYDRNAFIFLDQMNREGKTAEKVAGIYGANFKLFTRDSLHYLDILPNASDLVGSGAQYHHAHTYGFHKKCKLQTYSAVFGGLFSDALLKGARIKKINKTGKLPFVPEMKNKNYSPIVFKNFSIFEDSALMELSSRKEKHFKYVRSFRKDSADEWFELWPSSMNMNIPNLYVNRRLFRSYEPFMSNEVVKISATVPQNWKLNRRLFHKMAKPLLKPTKWLKHADGWYPYYSWISKSIVLPFFLITRKIGSKLHITKGNQGPWAEWDVILSSKEWIVSLEKYSIGKDSLSSVLKEMDINKGINSSELNFLQRINFLQTLYQISRNIKYYED